MLRSSNGFTLIELLTVTLIIGLLAVIALPKFVGTRERAARSAVQSDLRNLATAQENYFANNLVYTGNVSSLNFSASPSVEVSIPEANVSGWRATATHTSLPAEQCEIYFGSASGATTATLEGVIACS